MKKPFRSLDTYDTHDSPVQRTAEKNRRYDRQEEREKTSGQTDDYVAETLVLSACLHTHHTP